MHDSEPVGLFTTVLRLLNPLGLAYVHLIEPRSRSTPQGLHRLPTARKRAPSEGMVA